MSTYSYRTHGTKNKKDYPEIIESEPPSFPRPSSSIARSRLKNRLISKSFASPNKGLLPLPPKHDRDDEFRHQIRHDQESQLYRNDNDNDSILTTHETQHQQQHQESVSDSQYSVRFGSTDVVESFAWGGEDSVVYKQQDQEHDHDAENVKMNYLHSKIIPSYSLYVPGYESTVPRPPMVQQVEESNTQSDHDPSTVILSSAYGKSFQSNDMEVAVDLILSGKKEFCYLQEVDPDDQYRLVLSFNNVSKETRPGRYITLSANGIVRYYEGGMDSVTLREYLREYKYYYRLIKIPVIGQFRKWKSFLILKKYVLASRRRKRMAYLYPHLFILDESFQTMLLYVNCSAAILNEREVARLTKVLFTISSPNFFEIQDTLLQNKLPITKNDLAPKKFEAPTSTNDEKHIVGDKSKQHVASLASYEPVTVTTAMTKDEILFHIVCCIQQKVSRRFQHEITDVIPHSLLESNFRFQSSIDMIATREGNRNRSVAFEKAAKRNVFEKEKAAALKSNDTARIQEHMLMAQRMNEDENISYTQRSANRLNCRRIANAVRIVDFVVRDYLYLAAESCLTSFLSRLKMLRCGEVKCGEIGLKMVIRDLRKTLEGEGGEEERENVKDDDSQAEDVDFNMLEFYGIDLNLPPPRKQELDLELYPNKNKAIQTLRTLVTQIFDACRHETSLLHHEMLNEIFQPIANEIADCTILDLIYFDEQNSIHELANQIAHILEEDMTRCERTLHEYSFLLETYCRTANEANALTVEILSSFTVAEISKKLSDITAECSDIMGLPKTISVGITTLNISDAVQLVLGQVNNIQAAYFNTIPQLFVVLGEQLYHTVHNVKVVLTQKFSLVKDYVKAIEVFNKAKANVPEVEKAFEFLVGLKNIIHSSKIPSTDEMFGIDTTLKTEYAKYQLSLNDFEEGMEEITKHFQKELLSRSKTVIVPIEEIESSLASDLFGSPDSDADDVLASVVKLEMKFKAACDESAYLVKCQELMQCFVFDGLQADRIQQQIVLNQIVWKAVKNIRSLLLHIMETHFLGIECVPMQLKVRAISKTLSKLADHDPSDVEVWVNESTTLIDSLLPMIIQLQLGSYTPEQEAEIEALLDCHIYTDNKALTCSGQKLIDLNALRFSSDIEAIYHRNVCESNLHKKLHEMQTQLERKEVHIAQDREITYRITNLVECSEMLENLVITTKVCLQSDFVKLVKDDYSLFYEKVQGYDQLVKWIIVFQQEGLRLRAFYTNPKITRFVHQGFKYFNVVDESWRSLIKVGRSDNLLVSLLSSSRLKNVDIINNALTIAFDVVYMYLESQRVSAPRLYFLSDTQCFDMFRNTDMKSIFALSGTTLFPNVSSFLLGADGENVFVEGVKSGTESIRFKSACPLKAVLSDWINDIDKMLTEHVIEDIKVLVTDERSIIEDARYPICTNQSKIVGLEVKFWTSLKESFQIANQANSTEMQKGQKTTILDNIVILGTISSMSKDSYQVQSVATMIICLIQQRDLLQKVFGENAVGEESSRHFEENAFFLECAMQKFYDKKTSEITVRHFSTELSYGYKYLGFFTSRSTLVPTPLTEKCYLSISASFVRTTSQQMPFLQGETHGSQLETLLSVTQAFGLELFPVNCALMDPTAVETAIKRCIIGTVGGKFHTCFTNIESLNETSYSFLISSLTSTMMKLSAQPKEKKSSKTKFDLLQSIQLSQNAHFSLCLSVSHTSEATYFPASIRKRFRPLHIISPRFSEVLTTYLEAYGFDSPGMACTRLSGFLDHVSTSCAIDHNLLLKLLIQEVIPLVGNSLVRSNSVDMSQQCYLVVKFLFRHIPSFVHACLNTRNIQYACSFFLNIYFDPTLHLSDFKEQIEEDDEVEGGESACGKLMSALGNKSCAIVIGGIDCGKTSIIREAVGQLEGYGSVVRKGRSTAVPEVDTGELNVDANKQEATVGGRKPHESFADLARSSTMNASLIAESDTNKHALASRNGLYDVDHSYPKKLFRHQINPLLFNNIDIEANNLLYQISWSGVSTNTSVMAKADRKGGRASALPIHTDGEEGESKLINNKRHFDSLDRFLYDISSKEDVSYLHMDIANSSILSHYMNRLTHNSPNKYSPSLTSMGFKLIWECSEIRHIDPGLASSVPIVYVSESNYSPEDTLRLQMQYFVTKFDYILTDDEINKGLTTPLAGCLTNCVNIFVRPFLNPTTFSSLKAVQSINVVIRSFFEIATAMYAYIGLDVSTLIHPQLITVIYDSKHQENSVIEKQLWNQVTFYCIMAFASMWSFGSCSPTSHETYDDVLITMRDHLMADVKNWTADLDISKRGWHCILPPHASWTEDRGEDFFPFSEYCLQRVDSDDVEMKWVHWKQLTPFVAHPSQSNSMAYHEENFYCTVSDYYQETLFVPTHLSVLSCVLKDALICDKMTSTTTVTSTKWKAKSSTLAILGNPGVGKSSLLYMLANSMTRTQWKGIIYDGSPYQVQQAIPLAQDVYHSYLLENNLPFVGALFIDDVNLAPEAAVDVDHCGSEFYRTVFSDDYYYDSQKRKWLHLEKTMFALSGTLPSSSSSSSSTCGGQTQLLALNQRMLQYCIAFAVPDAGNRMANIFSAKFQSMCTSIQEDLSFDIANITLKLFCRFRAAALNECNVLPMIRTCPASRQVKYVFASIRKAFEDIPNATPLEVCKQWKKIISRVGDGSFVEKAFCGILENLLNNNSEHKSNIKGIIFKSQGDNKASANHSNSSIRSSVRSSFRPTLNAMSIVKTTPCDTPIEEADPNAVVYNSIILMTSEALLVKFLPDIQHLLLNHFQLVDFENLLFWKDVQKCAGFLLLSDAPFALFWGPSKPILNVIVESACCIMKLSYIPFTMDGSKTLTEFTIQYIHSFCYFLLVAHERDLKLNNKFVETIRRHRQTIAFEDGTMLVPESMLKLWHIHFNDINTDINSLFWSQLLAILQFQTPEMHVILRNVYDISFGANSILQKYFMQFLSHVKVVFSFGPNINATEAVKELSYVPKLCHQMQNVFFSPMYRMNNSLMLNVFDDVKVSDKLTRAITSIVSDAAAHSVVEHCFFLDLISHVDYEEGTYGMISQMFQLSIDPSSASVWDRYSAEFILLEKISEVKSDINTDSTIDDNCDNNDERNDDIKMKPQKEKLSNVVWACVSSRFLTICDVSKRKEFQTAILSDMTSHSLSPVDVDIRRVTYAYMHTLVETERVTVPDGFVELFDTVLLCGRCVQSMAEDFCAVLLPLLSEGAVRIIGSAHYVIQLVADLCNIEVKESAFNMHQCDSFYVEEMVTVSEDQTKMLFHEAKTRSASHSFTESVLSFSAAGANVCADAKAGRYPPTSRRTAVVVFDLQNPVSSDLYVLYFLLKGSTHNKLLFESFVHFNRIAKELNTPPSALSNEIGREQFLSKVCEDTNIHYTQSQALTTQWVKTLDSITPLCQMMAAMSSSVAAFHPTVYKGMPDQFNTFMKNLSFKQKASPMASILKELLTYHYRLLSEQVDTSLLLVLKMQMLIFLTELDHRVSHSLVPQIFYLLQKRQGLLGLHSSPAHNDDIIPTSDSFDVLNLLFEYLNQVQNSSSPSSSSSHHERIGMDELQSLFLTHVDEIEEWANMYSNSDHDSIPFPETELHNLSYTEKILIVAVLKPISLKVIISQGIVDLTTWNVFSIDSAEQTSSCLKESPSMEEDEDSAVILLYENPSGAFDVSNTSFLSDGQVPHYSNALLLSPTHASGNDTLASTCEHLILSSRSDTTVSDVIHYLAKQPKPVCDGSIVESQCDANVIATATMKAAHVSVQKMNTMSLMWYNFPALLKRTLQSIMGFHEEHSLIMTTVKLEIPKLLVRSYWLLALYHVSVLIRLAPFHTSVGDDTLKYASRLLMQLRVRSKHAPELLFSKLNALIKQIYHQVYDLTADSLYVKNLSYALFKNIFTEDSTDPDLDYYLLGLLPLPAALDNNSIVNFVEDISLVLSSGECIHIADFIGCTNGELYEIHLKHMMWSALYTNSKFFKLARNNSFALPDTFQPLLSKYHPRILPAVTLLLAELPPLIAINEDADDAMLKSLCTTTQRGSGNSIGKKKSLVLALRGDNFSIGDGQSRKSVNNNNGNTNNNSNNKTGENHLWFFLQLEIESFNTSVMTLKKVLSTMLDPYTCVSQLSSQDILEHLEQSLVPPAWLKFSVDEDQRPKVSLSAWVRQLFVRRKMLNVWLTQRYPEYIYLHLLQNPAGFLYALKQCFAEGQNVRYEDVVIDARILKLPYTSLERHSEIAKINAGNLKQGVQAYSIVIAGAHMMNARWLEEQYNLEFLNPSFASKFSQELYLKISATCEDCQDEDDYQCPVYTSPDFPTADSISASSTCESFNSNYRHRDPLFHVSIPSQCSLVEWKKRNVTMHASPEWHIPDV